MPSLRLRIKGRLYVGFMALVAVGLVMAGVAVLNLRSVQDQVGRLSALSDSTARTLEVSTHLQAIQRANLRSLAAGTKTADILQMATDFRARHPNVPLVLMGYANPMITRGPEWFAAEAAKAGVDGVICVDIPPEEDSELGPNLRAHGISPIRLATPTTDAARLPAVLEGSSGFLYYVSVAGITGMQQAALASIEEAVTRIKQTAQIPVAVGFGVRTPEQAGPIAQVADGVVVGSALIDLIAEHGENAAGPVRELVTALANAVHNARKVDA